MRSPGWALAGAVVLACGPAMWGQTDEYPEKLKRGCVSVDQCRALEAEAKGRVDRCKSNTVGYIRCDDARADLRAARSLLESARGRDEAERDEVNRRRAEQERRQSQEENAARVERERKARQDAEEEREKQAFDAQVARETERSSREKEEHDRQVEYLRLLSASQRAQRLRECHVDEEECAPLVALLLEAVKDEKERKTLVQANERYLRNPPKAAPAVRSGPATIQCCDGTRSPTCGCDRSSFRGCCSHHGGICGGCD